RTASEHRQVREQGVHAPETPGRAGCAAAPRQAWRQADEADQGSSGLHRRAGRWAVQAGPLSVLGRRAGKAGRTVVARPFQGRDGGGIISRQESPTMKRIPQRLTVGMLIAFASAVAIVHAQQQGSLTAAERTRRWD